jgi:hypothetical protein
VHGEVLTKKNFALQGVPTPQGNKLSKKKRGAQGALFFKGKYVVAEKVL